MDIAIDCRGAKARSERLTWLQRASFRSSKLKDKSRAQDQEYNFKDNVTTMETKD